MNPRILVLTNIFPTAKRPMSGSYVDDRVEAHRELGAHVTVVPLRMRTTSALGVWMSRTGRDSHRAGPGQDVGAEYKMTIARMLESHRGAPLDALISEAAHEVERLVDVSSFDAIHAHGMFRVPAGAVAHRLSQKHGVPYVVTAHGSDINFGMPKRPALFVDTLAAARSVMYVSPALLRTAVDLGAPQANAIVTPNGVDPDVFAEGPAEREPVVLYVGGLAKVKGADRLPEIFRSILAKSPKTRFEIVGGGALESQIRAGLDGVPVTWHGTLPREGVARAMQGAALLIIPSRNEGWPCVVHEAFACGTPVVATDVGGLAAAVGVPEWIVADGPEVEERLASTASTVLSSRQDRGALRATAEKHSWRAVAATELTAMGLA
ncbi:glycosyltransferase [Kytococcus sedentarius]|uniref:glycosyltransferase n=1 Tax=Kytococcus sedentarius TaxID=1276 RepID=UPI0035BBA743